MPVHKLHLTVMLCLCAFACGDSSGFGLAQESAHRSAIVGGAAAPTLEWSLQTAQHNAVVLVSHTVAGGIGECSGTWIGGRVIVTAAHCVLDNNDAWWLEGAAPVVSSPDQFTIAFGPHRDALSCALDVESVEMASALPMPSAGVIDRDMALVVLRDHPMDSCWSASTPLEDAALPIPVPARSLVGATLPVVDQRVLVGGFGFVDDAYTQQGPRAFANLAVDTTQTQADYFIARDAGEGMPAHGDSGGLVAADQGQASVVLVGVTSTVVPPLVAVTSMERMRPFWEARVESTAHLCPDITARCFERARVVCADGVLDVEPCPDGCDADTGTCVHPPVAPEEPEPEAQPEPAAPPGESPGDSGCSATSATSTLGIGLLLFGLWRPRRRSRR